MFVKRTNEIRSVTKFSCIPLSHINCIWGITIYGSRTPNGLALKLLFKLLNIILFNHFEFIFLVHQTASFVGYRPGLVLRCRQIYFRDRLHRSKRAAVEASHERAYRRGEVALRGRSPPITCTQHV